MSVQQQGYYRAPTLWKDQIVFVSEDEMWSICLGSEGACAHRLSTGIGVASCPAFSQDGKDLAFISSQEGSADVYCMSASGGESRRLTYFGSAGASVLGWTATKKILITTAAFQPFRSLNDVFTLDPQTGDLERLKVGHANDITFAPDGSGACAIQRHGGRDYSHWKRYRGGTAGQLWIDASGKGEFQPLISLDGNLSSPLWIGDRIYFLSDHEGIGRLYSCTPKGQDLRTEVKHKEFYVRQTATDGEKVVYHAGADLYVFDPKTTKAKKVDFSYPSARPQRARKLVGVRNYLESCTLHPNGHHLALSARGKAVALPNWEGSPLYLGDQEGNARYRQSAWLGDGEHVVLVRAGEERDTLEVYRIGQSTPECVVDHKDIGHVLTLKESPCAAALILTNHRGELLHIEISKKPKVKILDESLFESIEGVDWSLDGQWIAYSAATSRHVNIIKIAHVASGKIQEVTQPILRDTDPSFSPCGRYLYFLGGRQFDPSYDTLHFDLSFPRSTRPYAILLQKDLVSPFMEKPKELARSKEVESGKEDQDEPKKKSPKVQIDFDGIQDRLLPFPVRDGIYGQILGVKGKVLFTAFGQPGTLNDILEDESDSDHAGVLLSYDFETHKVDEIAHSVSSLLGVSADREWMSYGDMDGDIRVLKSGEKGEEDAEAPPSKRGWINLSRVDLSITALQEWGQIFDEAWRLQKDFFWIEDMSDVNWKRVKKRYEPLLERISSRSELTDLLWEMQGELGTSHAYVVGGDLKRSPRYRQGLLGAEFSYDTQEKAYRIQSMVRGDTWKSGHHSPLLMPGVGLSEKDLLHSIDGQLLTQEKRPEMCLINSADRDVSLEVSNGKGAKKKKERRTVLVKPLACDLPVRYRDWVEKNRAYVHEKSKGTIGYIHIPDMGPWGYSEFHRSFLPECDRDGLIVDVRFNGGGHVSSLILEKLSRKRLGYDVSRWHGRFPYPADSTTGVMVGLTNEYAGSDGDMFSHGFKMLKLGPLIGKRTWGGVIGMETRHRLADRGYTTQPEYSFWFKDVGWRIENYGVDPDIEVDNAPQDYEAGKDLQLDRALVEVKKIAAGHKEELPDIKTRPRLTLPVKG
ncbi:MAG: peptidase [bacterium]|nr:peptidase [bacterium]